MTVFLKIVPNEFVNERRDERELEVVDSLGLKTIVIAKSFNQRVVDKNNTKIYYFSTRPLGHKKIFVHLNRVMTIFIWAYHARKMSASIISGHDLSGLMIAWLSTLFLRPSKRPDIIYDSHEFELGRMTRKGARSQTVKRIIKFVEGFLIKRCSLILVVNESIATKLGETYRLSTRPTVIYNYPHYVDIDPVVISETRDYISKINNFDSNCFIVMYHGNISRGRGISEIISIADKLEGCKVVLLGNGDVDYIKEMKRLVMYHKLEDIVFFMEAVPSNILWQYVSAADLELVLIENSSESYYLSSPNKLFESIQSLTPILGSDFPEIDKVINGYQIGLTCNPSNKQEIIDKILLIKNKTDMRETFVKNLNKAKQELTWEVERKKLVKSYSKIIDNLKL